MAITYTASGLPDGVVFDDETRTITGTPGTAGDGEIVVTATDDNGDPAKYTIPYSISE